MKINRSFVVGLLYSLLSSISYAQDSRDIEMIPSFSEDEKRLVQSLSNQKYSQQTATGNRVSGNPEAIKFGKQLFFDKRLSGDGKAACSSCHDPVTSWTKHEEKTNIRKDYPAKRHVPTLWGVRYNRWYFWDGSADSLWGQALVSLQAKSEMASSAKHIATLVVNQARLKKSYQALFGEIPNGIQTKLSTTNPCQFIQVEDDTHKEEENSEEETANEACEHQKKQKRKILSKLETEQIDTIFVNIAKAIASFEETITADNTPFDQFAEQLLLNQCPKENAISPAAAEGLKLFIGKAGCINCHFGTNFSDGEFHHSFLPLQKRAGTPPDYGRYAAIDKLLQSPFNSKSRFYDEGEDDKPNFRNRLDYLYKNAEFRGQFKTPSLRNIAKTYPYMHTGEYSDLETVINHYNTISERINTKKHKEVLLKSLSLSTREQKNIIEFLKSLSTTEEEETL